MKDLAGIRCACEEVGRKGSAAQAYSFDRRGGMISTHPMSVRAAGPPAE